MEKESFSSQLQPTPIIEIKMSDEKERVFIFTLLFGYIFVSSNFRRFSTLIKFLSIYENDVQFLDSHTFDSLVNGSTS